MHYQVVKREFIRSNGVAKASTTTSQQNRRRWLLLASALARVEGIEGKDRERNNLVDLFGQVWTTTWRHTPERIRTRSPLIKNNTTWPCWHIPAEPYYTHSNGSGYSTPIHSLKHRSIAMCQNLWFKVCMYFQKLARALCIMSEYIYVCISKVYQKYYPMQG